MVSGRYRTERLSRFWSKNKEGFCLLPSCHGNMVHEDLEHILVHCGSLQECRDGLMDFTTKFSHNLTPSVTQIVQKFINPISPQFLLDCSCLPEVVMAVQQQGDQVLQHLSGLSGPGVTPCIAPDSLVVGITHKNSILTS